MPHASLPPTALAAVATPAGLDPRALDLPPAGPDDGLLRVEATGVAPGDRSAGHDGREVVPGREIVGRVVRIGEHAARRWGVGAGDRVVVEEFAPCGGCRACRAGDPPGCGAGPRYGATPVSRSPGLYGGFSDYLYLHPRAVPHRVGDAVDPRTASLFAPLAAGIRWISQQAGTRVGDTVVVHGTGRRALGCVVAARHAGAGRVVLAGPAADLPRLHIARHLGADHVVFSDEEDVAAAVAGLTGGAGADTVVHLGRGAGTLDGAVALAATGGTVVLAGGPDRAELPYATVVRRRLRLLGAAAHDPRSVPAALEVIRSGRHPLHLMTTHHFPLAEAALALRTAGRRGGDAIHVTVGA